ncbi:hypothetical protein HN51_009784 [Arachis hypogaea]|uniref:Transcription repressor n=1 Tax=Arachis hypogaea TaxID=3818 RepID=A0A445E5I7_ARAHY|nr:transcription repressor OFP8-like [Arachis hypogaea]QHO55233.1 Transcription repressor [Arachis hypogaea]RYR70575.1 hypothetical protein Ahy_A03g017047 [Arachis hypogaea]
MSSNNKQALFKTVFTINGSCGCGKTKALEVHEPTPKPKISIHQNNTNTTINNPSSMASSFTTTSHNGAFSGAEDEDSSTTISESETTHEHISNNLIIPKRSPLMDTLAVEKDSSDPYHDFRHSMLQMIFEKEIESKDDLQDLLQCFLQLNAPHYHHIIVKAFNQICEEAFPEKVCTTTPSIDRRSSSCRNTFMVHKTCR